MGATRPEASRTHCSGLRPVTPIRVAWGAPQTGWRHSADRHARARSQTLRAHTHTHMHTHTLHAPADI
eukprot:8740043-Pyramimonas_sp.AAC.1